MNHTLPALSKRYSDNPTFILESPELSLSGEGYTCIIGINGSGKSTFGETLAEISANNPGEKWYYLPQHLDRFLFAENLSEQLSALLSQEINQPRLISLIEELGFSDPEGMLHFPFLLMSGGERRRMALVCVFYLEPVRLILDEPEIGVTAKENMVLLSKLHNLTGKNTRVIIISHNAAFVRQSSDIICLINGKIARTGQTKDLLSDPTFELEKYGVRFSQ
ncbi:MAG: ATP-binding cassette domain-containing protein [Candidatus Marinimicrobia bacterium]|jgi:ABC-type Mn2+/Zn2+ transport system ATPase subunit|nr:ATP-binding cassette domain-containing protein [Candidatus Neomarinimicrobiota bacterium]MBT4360798.1 ATP-binding cassette domain-containing protein [Candidatus Neomarinimicrobiota bacterium]MBT4713370.1 ATP-binding cassette domain-containing protein [Candidatus Neomarinimicrobiota bacterium]MBT4944988.1 ATP-binding cassette domain-containing protein [Candidatus Neomarinimicrobiota bacterium]MBT5271403.1 ATP-binding cassette domain-containing protein [Candidatus Neomarinimicrobiota bacterium